MINLSREGGNHNGETFPEYQVDTCILERNCVFDNVLCTLHMARNNGLPKTITKLTLSQVCARMRMKLLGIYME